MKSYFITPEKPLLIIANQCQSSGTGEGWFNFKWVEAISHHVPLTLLIPRSGEACHLKTRLPQVEIVCLGHNREEIIDGSFRYGDFNKDARIWIREQLNNGRQFSIAHDLTSSLLESASPLIGLGVPYVLGMMGRFPHEQTGALHEPDRLNRGYRQVKSSALIERSLRQAHMVLGHDDFSSRLLEHLGIENFSLNSQIEDVPMPTREFPSIADGQMNILSIMPDSEGRGSATLSVVDEQLKDIQGVTLQTIDASAVKAQHYEDSDLLITTQNSPDRDAIILEAFHHGLPVIAVNEFGQSDLVDQTCGMVLAQSDETSTALKITEKVSAIQSRPFLLTPMRLGAMKKFWEMSVWCHSGRKAVELYEGIIDVSGFEAVAAF